MLEVTEKRAGGDAPPRLVHLVRSRREAQYMRFRHRRIWQRRGTEGAVRAPLKSVLAFCRN